MQLQEGMAAYEAAGVRLYMLSYDEVDALADFSKAHQVTYTMLSDTQSKVVREFGILNTSIPEDDHPWYGIPFPGAYAINADGVITAKFFEHNFAVRAGPEQMLAAAQGKAYEIGSAGPPVADVQLDVRFEGENLPVGVTREIVARFRVPEGRHLYGEPAPEGLVAATIELDDSPGVLAYTPVAPPTTPLTLAGTGETLEVYEGDVVLRLPVTQNARVVTREDGKAWVQIAGRVRWQSCDANECGLPETESFSFRVRAKGGLYPDMGPMEGKVPAMNGAKHFGKMMERHKA